MSDNSKVIKQACVELEIGEKPLLADYSLSQELVSRTNRRVAIFGGSCIQRDSVYYENARFFANKVALAGISVMTGGGPGIMEAGNMGACSAENDESISYGIRVNSITGEMIRNPFLQKSYEFDTLSLRLLSLISSCDVAVLFPGGFGTLEEMFSLLVRIRVKMLQKIPVYLFGREFWQGLVVWMEENLVRERVIDPRDMNSFKLVDCIEDLSTEVVDYIRGLNQEERQVSDCSEGIAEDMAFLSVE